MYNYGIQIPHIISLHRFYGKTFHGRKGHPPSRGKFNER